MATRVKKASTKTTESPTTSSKKSSGYIDDYSQSPEVLNEKILNLNERLAVYIGKKHLDKLGHHITSTDDAVIKKLAGIKSLYDGKLGDAKGTLADVRKELAKARNEADTYKTEADEWKTKYMKSDRHAKITEKKNQELQADINVGLGQLQAANNTRKQAEEKQARMQGELAESGRRLKELQKTIEDGRALLVNLENKVKHLEEKLQLQNSIHEEELQIVRAEASGKYVQYRAKELEGYKGKLHEMLKAMADGHEERLRQVKNNLEELSKNKNAELEGRLLEMERLLKREREQHEAELANTQYQLDHLRKTNVDQQAAYLEQKLKLENQIEAYRLLLEGAENGWKMLNNSTTQNAYTPESTPVKEKRGMKRRLDFSDLNSKEDESTENEGYSSSYQAKTSIEIQEVDPKGRYIKIYNSGDKVVVLSGWLMKHVAGKHETVYTFPRNLQIKSGQSCTIWSSTTDTTHDPPTDLVMKGQRWYIADTMKTVLLDDDVEQASLSLTNFDVSGGKQSKRTRRGKSPECAVM